MSEYLAIGIPVALAIGGWVISVERRITTLQAIAADIHDIKSYLEPISKLFNVSSLIHAAQRERDE